jgi:hypothetical protein
MRHIIPAITLAAAGLLALPAFAQEPGDGDESDSPRRPVARERIMRAFDRDNDGRLSDEERAAVREQLGDRFIELRERVRELRDDRADDANREGARRRDGGGDRGRNARPDAERERRQEGNPAPEARRAPRDEPPSEARRDAEPRRDEDRPREERAREERRIRVQLRDRPEGRQGPDGPRGPLGPFGGSPERNIQALFGWFDADGDNLLSRREFAELSQFVERRRPGRPDGPPGPDRVGRRGPFALPADGDEIRPFIRRERLEQRLRDETRRRDDRAERRPDRGEPPRPPRPADPPGPPSASERNRPDAI